MAELAEGNDGDADMRDGKWVLRMSLDRKYINAEGPSVLVSPSGMRSCVPSKIGSI